MREIQKDFSPPALVTAIEANQFASLADLGRSSRVELHEEPHLVWFIGGVKSPMFNRVLRAQFQTSDVEARLETAGAA